MVQVLASAQADQFASWCSETDRGDFAIDVTDTQVAFGASDGTAWVMDANDTALLSLSLRTAVQSGRRWWAHGATQVAGVLYKSTRLRFRGLLCTQVLTRTLKPETIDQDEPLVAAASDAAARAVECARLVGTRRVEASREQRALAMDECKIEDLWRWPAARGYRVDKTMLDQELSALEQARDAGLRRHGIDLTRDVDDTRRWLLMRGIRITDADGKASLVHKRYAHATVPDGAREDWEAFVNLRDRARVSNKLTEMASFLTPERRVYPTIHGIGAVTGRMSISRPALQNLPASLRGLLLADEGHVLVGCDLDRVEPRVVAAITQDPALIEAVKGDVYTELAVSVFGESAHGDAAAREVAKTAFLALIYGQGAKSLAANLTMTEEEARQISRDLLAAYPVMAAWMRDVKRRAAADEPLTTIYGRRLPSTPDKPYRAINWIVQGSAADLFKQLTLAVVERLGRDALWLPVHDELIVQVPEADAVRACAALGEAMSTTLCGVPITGSPVVLGARWAKA